MSNEKSKKNIGLATEGESFISSTGERTKKLKSWRDSYANQIPEVEKLFSTMNKNPFGMMFADRGLVLRYINPVAMDMLKPLEPFLPERVDCLLGLSIDRLVVRHGDLPHGNWHSWVTMQGPADTVSPPYHGQINIGPKTLDLKVSGVSGNDNLYLGVIAFWADITAA